MTLAETELFHELFKSKNLFQVCILIFENDEITPTEICESLKFQPSYTSQLLGKLKEFLQKNISNNFQRTRISIKFTKEFSDFFKKIYDFYKKLGGTEKNE